MQVILLEHIQGVGKMGQVVKVARGFARNFLLPRNKALLANQANLAHYDAQKETRAADMAAAKEAATALAATVAEANIQLERQASDVGMLYGSVKARDLAAQLHSQHQLDIPAAAMMIGKPIKEIGEHTVKVALHPEVIVTLNVSVVRVSQ